MQTDSVSGTWIFLIVLLSGYDVSLGAQMAHDSKIPRIDERREEFREPNGFCWGYFLNAQDANIRYGWVAPDGAVRAVAVLTPGRGAPIEKYFEPIRELRSRGFAVWSMDWRGQGGSDRYLGNPQKGHSLGFEHDVADLDHFINSIVERKGKPTFFVAGSMGAHIAIRYMHDRPGSVDFAVLVSPMLDIHTGKWPRWVIRTLAKLATTLGFRDHYIPGGRDWTPDASRLEEARLSTSDPERYSVAYTYLRERTELRVGDPTYGWLALAFESIAAVKERAYLTSISTPVLMVSAMSDRQVLPEPQSHACDVLPNCEFVPVEGARHDLYMECDEYRNMLYGAIEKFASTRLTSMY